MNKNVLFVAPHPDDETLGCGGSILKHKANGEEIHWLILTKANQKLNGMEDFVGHQKAYIERAAKEYGFNSCTQLGFTEIELENYSFAEIINQIKIVFNHIQPEVLYIHNRNDVQSDHRTLFDAVYA